MPKPVSHAVSTQYSYINPRSAGTRGDIGLGLIPHILQILTCHVNYIIYFNYTSSVFCVGVRYWSRGVICGMQYRSRGVIQGMRYRINKIEFKQSLIMHVQKWYI